MTNRGSRNALTTTAGLTLGLLGVTLAASAIWSRSRERQISMPPIIEEPPAPTETPFSAYQRVAIAHVAGSEAGPSNPNPFEAINANTDGAGLSYGIIQWAQKKGGLGKLLLSLQASDPEAFASIFGIPWRELLQSTNASSESARMAPVGGVLLWREPWLSRFRLAGRHPPFTEAQWNMALNDVHMTSALKAARMLGLTTLRGLTLIYDRAVQQGPYGTLDKAKALAQEYATRGFRPSYQQVMADFQSATLAPLVDTAPQDESWRRVGDVWHKFRGGIDLHADVLKRTTRVLNSPTLTDEPIPTFPA